MQLHLIFLNDKSACFLSPAELTWENIILLPGLFYCITVLRSLSFNSETNISRAVTGHRNTESYTPPNEMYSPGNQLVRIKYTRC